MLTTLPGRARVLLVESALGLDLAVVAAPVELAVVAAPEVVELAVVDVEGLLALPFGVPLVALDAVVVACRLPPLGNTVLAWDE